jgi:hypothetical protein
MKRGCRQRYLLPKRTRERKPQFRIINLASAFEKVAALRRQVPRARVAPSSCLVSSSHGETALVVHVHRDNRGEGNFVVDVMCPKLQHMGTVG